MRRIRPDLRKTKALLSHCLVRESGTLLDALRTIDRGGIGIAFVVDARGRMVGATSDGDVRRALLRGASLESPLTRHVRRTFTSVGPDAGRAEVLDLMQARLIRQIPILDSRRRPVGVHLLHEIIGAVERPNWAVVMAGGRGTRLGSITEAMPKPMVRVAGRPILERLVLHLVGFGLRRIYLGIGYLGEQIERHFKDGSGFGCSIGYLRDGSQALGTGGALSLLPERPRDPVVVLNGDLVTQANLAAMLDFHARGRFAATLGVRRYFHQVPFGSVEASNGRVRGFEEKPAVQKLVNAGVYVLQPEVVRRVPRRFFPITNLFDQCLARREPVGAFEIQEDWIDVGQREQLRQAQQGIS